MYKKCKVVLLPTNEKAILALNNDMKTLLLAKNHYLTEFDSDTNFRTQNLYILSDDEIKEGDYYFAILHNKVWQASKGFINSIMINPKSEYKVIVSTDPSLSLFCKYCHHKKVIPTGLCEECGRFSDSTFPSPSQSFIEKYVSEYNKGNIITEVMVEYDTVWVRNTDRNVPTKADLDEVIKINPKDNTITIKKIKDSWNKEEVIELINKAVEFVVLPAKNKELKDLNKWIETNL